ncbi:MAG TPA: DUF6677 family protein [Thermoanaerobaculia bacterium]|nr:DUF6677 family protein [Thermoanaerobaculia bacterium]
MAEPARQEGQARERPERVSALPGWVASIAAWVLPGLGHLLLGRRGRASLFFLLVLAAVGIGYALEGKLYTPVPGRPLTVLATLGAMGMGLPYFLLRFTAGYTGDVAAPGFEYGTAFLLSAGLMNLLLVLDAWDIASGRKE